MNHERDIRGAIEAASGFKLTREAADMLRDWAVHPDRAERLEGADEAREVIHRAISEWGWIGPRVITADQLWRFFDHHLHESRKRRGRAVMALAGKHAEARQDHKVALASGDLAAADEAAAKMSALVGAMVGAFGPTQYC